MTVEERKIIDLYTISNLSEQQIAEKIFLPSSRVRWVIKKYKIPKRSISEAIRNLNITKFKKKEFILNTNLNPEQKLLKLAGVMLYWGEGTKGGNTLALHNSDPSMVALYIRFLREVCGIDNKRLHITLHRYPDQDEVVLKKFWSRISKIPLAQFHRPHVHRDTKGSYKKKSQYGTVGVVYSDTKLLGLMNDWIAEYKALLLKPE